jgi:hypothetical protein
VETVQIHISVKEEWEREGKGRARTAW